MKYRMWLEFAFLNCKNLVGNAAEKFIIYAFGCSSSKIFQMNFLLCAA